jgi:hypothetical protein
MERWGVVLNYRYEHPYLVVLLSKEYDTTNMWKLQRSMKDYWNIRGRFSMDEDRYQYLCHYYFEGGIIEPEIA